MSSRRASQKRRWARLVPIATAVLLLSIGAAIASAESGGGTSLPSPPRVSGVECVRDCSGLRSAGEGSVIRLVGRNLGGVSAIGFRKPGGWIRVGARGARGRQVSAVVPEGAVTGRVRAFGGAGHRAASRQRLRIVDGRELSDVGAFSLSEAQATPQRSYFFGPAGRQPRVSYVFNGDGPTDIRIEVVRNGGKDRVVRSWVQRAREPRTTHTASWNGRTNDGKAAGDGAFRFRVGAVGNGRAETTANARFGFYSHIFPVRGRPRGWGDGFGAGRNHRGQDIFARCGTPLVAARGGKVRWNRWHGAAGWYVVIAGRGTGRDYVYMHLRRRSKLRPGQTVRTGQRIGRLGETGNASGCHLHFELWTKPGWYQGGRPMRSVTRHMRRWASWS